MPEEFSAKVHLPPRRIWDQGDDINCCLSCALASCLEALKPKYPELSPLFHYYFARPSHTVLLPLTISEAFFASHGEGFCRLQLHDKEFTEEGALDPPLDPARDDGENHRTEFDPDTGDPLYFWIPGFDELRLWKRALMREFPILVGITPDTSYWNMRGGVTDRWLANGLPVPGPKHAVAVLGYEDAHSAFIAQDSRGTSFADDGQWFLPYDVAVSQRVYAAYAIGVSTETGLPPEGGY